MTKFQRQSVVPYLGLMAGLVAIKVAIMFGPPLFRSPAQAAVFAWWFLGALLVAGLLGVWMSPRVAIPDLLDARVSNRARFLRPALIGLLLGAVILVSDRALYWSHPQAVEHGLDSIHIPFPASALIYPGGAIIVCVIYYLFPIPLLTWVVTKAFRGRRDVLAFWIVGLLAAAIEPVTQDLSPSMRALGVAMPIVFLIDFVENVAQVSVFRSAGFLAAVTLRVAFYVVWHIIPSLLGW